MVRPLFIALLACALMLAPSARAGGKNPRDDVNQIGSRDVGKGLDWYSLEKEIEMGRSLAQDVEAQSKMVTDPVITEYVNRVGQNIVRNSDAKIPFTIKVIDSDEVNAFALPGGFLYVNSGLVLEADNEAQLAAVMAHEVAHVCARHVTRQQTRSDLVNLASIPLIFFGGPIGMGLQAAASFLVPVGFLEFSRSFEREADYLGIQYMYKAGYDPTELLAFFEKIQKKEKKRPGTLAKAFSTHPQTPDRFRASQREIEHVLPPEPEYVITTSEFDRVKAQLGDFEKRTHGLKRRDQPTLRRKTVATTEPVEQAPGQPSAGDSADPDDARPTLRHGDNQ